MEPPPAYGPTGASSLWEDINDSPVWLDVLAALYAVVVAATLVQLVRMQSRIPEYGWTTQKIFHFLILLVTGARSLMFGLHRYAEKLEPPVLLHILLDIPTLSFFTTFAILILFWTEIFYQVKGLPTDRLKPAFYIINAIVYVLQIGLLFAFWRKPVRSVAVVLNVFIAVVSLFVAFAFLFFGGRVFLMIKRFPIESQGRSNKLLEVGRVVGICFCTLLLRCVMMCLSAAIKAADLYDLDHSVVIFVHFLLVEILPTSLVLFILRKLPKKKEEVPPDTELSMRDRLESFEA